MPRAWALFDAIRAGKMTGRYHTTGTEEAHYITCPACMGHLFTAEHIVNCNKMKAIRNIAQKKTLSFFHNNNNASSIFYQHFTMRNQASINCAHLRHEVMKIVDENEFSVIEALGDLNSKKTTNLISSSTGGYSIATDLMLRRWGMTSRAEQYQQKHQKRTRSESMWIFDQNVRKLALLQSLQQQLQYTTIDILYEDFPTWINEKKLTETDFYSPKSNTHFMHQILLTTIFAFFLDNITQMYPDLCAF